MTLHLDGPNREVRHVRDLARTLHADDPTIEHYTTGDDKSDVLFWAGALACAVLALAAYGLAELVLLIAQHWIGAAQGAMFAGMAGCIVWTVAAGRNWRWPR